jgi:hypothetical protein
MLLMIVAGLLARSLFNTFPPRRKRDSGMQIEQDDFKFKVCSFQSHTSQDFIKILKSNTGY